MRATTRRSRTAEGRQRHPARRTYHHGDLRRALIDASLGLLEEDGPNGVTLREAARRAGVSQAAPYRHFASKEALLAAVAEEGFHALRDATVEAAAPHRKDPLKTLIAIAVTYVRFAVDHPAHFRVMFGPVVLDKTIYPTLGTVTIGSFDAITQAIADCQRSGALRAGDPRLAAVALWTLAHGVAALAVDRQIPPPLLAAIPLERLTEGLTQMLLDGLVQKDGRAARHHDARP
ncbi:MAG: TetR/AcrR family transcriptional regulator [Deltaproteobacteria bacterium]|nr:MAG: TetR/AcrR family transcriptional regulator [Deltaproteobacteria bacterium]